MMKTPPFIDPLPGLLKTVTQQSPAAHRIAFGERFCAVMLENGQSGVCATLGVRAPENLPENLTPETETPAGRIVAQALINASLNRTSTVSHQSDALHDILQSGKKSMVMIGYFEPLIGPLRTAGMEVIVFDPAMDSRLVNPQCDLVKTLKNSTFAIITATAITNGTLAALINETSAKTEIWLVGPSTPLIPAVFKATPVTRLYGTLFPAGCHQLLDRVHEGSGAKGFNQLGQKVMVTV